MRFLSVQYRFTEKCICPNIYNATRECCNWKVTRLDIREMGDQRAKEIILFFMLAI